MYFYEISDEKNDMTSGRYIIFGRYTILYLDIIFILLKLNLLKLSFMRMVRIIIGKSLQTKIKYINLSDKVSRKFSNGNQHIDLKRGTHNILNA